MLGYVIISVISIVIGVTLSNIVRIILLSDGKMFVDQTDPDKDLYKLEIEDLDILPKKKTIILRVVVKAGDTPK